MTSFNPNQLSLDVDTAMQTVHDDQLGLEYGPEIEEKIEQKPKISPSVELGRRAIGLLSADSYYCEASKKNGFIKKLEGELAPVALIESAEIKRNSKNRQGDSEFSSAWGSVEDLVAAGFNLESILQERAKDHDVYLNNIVGPSNTKRRNRLRTVLKRHA